MLCKPLIMAPITEHVTQPLRRSIAEEALKEGEREKGRSDEGPGHSAAPHAPLCFPSLAGACEGGAQILTLTSIKLRVRADGPVQRRPREDASRRRLLLSITRGRRLFLDWTAAGQALINAARLGYCAWLLLPHSSRNTVRAAAPHLTALERRYRAVWGYFSV